MKHGIWFVSPYAWFRLLGLKLHSYLIIWIWFSVFLCAKRRSHVYSSLGFYFFFSLGFSSLFCSLFSFILFSYQTISESPENLYSSSSVCLVDLCKFSYFSEQFRLGFYLGFRLLFYGTVATFVNCLNVLLLVNICCVFLTLCFARYPQSPALYDTLLTQCY